MRLTSGLTWAFMEYMWPAAVEASDHVEAFLFDYGNAL